MATRLPGLMAAIGAAVLLGGCATSQPPAGADDQPREVAGAAFTFSVGSHRFAIAAFGSPALMVMVRLGPTYVWVTPSPALRRVYLEDVVGDQPDAGHVLDVNANGTADCLYALRWSR
jgi:hypothetical protein